MEALYLHILPVYSAYHSTEKIGEMRLQQHQVETLDAFHDADIDVVINIAMTGDGKSIAGYLPAIREQKHAVAMYPTNELIRDQYGALSQYGPHLRFKFDTMYSDKITYFMRERDKATRLDAVRSLLRRNDVLLTNPDLIHLMMSYQYGWDFLRKELVVTLGSNFDYFLFDEFHVFAVPQVISVINMMNVWHTTYRDNPNERKKFVFLSATPSKLFDSLLAHSGLRVRKIEGRYSSSDQGQAHRRILQPCEIGLYEIGQDAQATTETWVREHLEEIQRFFQQHRGSKAAILVSSPATARRLVRILKEYFEPLGITVGENSGLTPYEERLESLNKHILVGTSTVDIGIDFHINLLIFEAFNAGSFLQRFGRLGRHNDFSTYKAYALVPRFVLERMSTTFADEREIERERFNAALREAFPTEQEFTNYTKLWGPAQAAHILVELDWQKGRDENRAFRQALTEQYDAVYGTPEKPAMERGRKKYLRLRNQCPEILKELLSFRGQSPLECGVWDTTVKEIHPDGHLLTYDLFFLLANTEFEVIEEEEFLREVRRRGLEERDFRGKLLYLKVFNYVQERQGLILGLGLNFVEHAHLLHHVQELNGIFVREPRPIWRDRVNKKLKQLKLVCIFSDMDRLELKRKLQLGVVFPVYRLQDGWEHDYTVAFGQEALLLDSILAFRKTKGDPSIMA